MRVPRLPIVLALGFIASRAAAQTPVEVVRVTSKAVERQVNLPGEFQPYLAVPIFAKVAGFVKQVNVDRGSSVRKGQTLATLEAPEMLAQSRRRNRKRKRSNYSEPKPGPNSPRPKARTID